MLRTTLVAIICAAMLAGVPAIGGARTWYVERNGSGDFTTIQPAVDAAASGDTIRVGPGRYNEGQVATCPGWSAFVRVLVTKSELTIIGSGTSSIIGPSAPWDWSQGVQKGIVAMTYWGNYNIYIRDFAFENMSEAVHAERTGVENFCVYIPAQSGIGEGDIW